MSVFDELFDSPLATNLHSLEPQSRRMSPDEQVIPRENYPVLAEILPKVAGRDPVHAMVSIDPPAKTASFLTMGNFVRFIKSFPLHEHPTIYSNLRKLINSVPPPARPLQSNAADSAQHEPLGSMPQVNPFQRLPDYGGFEIIVLVTTHGGTPVTCPNRPLMINLKANQVYLPLTVDVTVMESSPCGVCSHEPASRDIVSYYKGVIDRNRIRRATDTPFLEALQKELRASREGNYNMVVTEAGTINSSQSYSSEYRGWNILKDEIHVLEREYKPDKRFCHMTVLYSTKGPFRTHQNLLDTYPIKYRSELISLLDKSGYTKILLLDLSCGVYEYESVRLDEAQDETRQRTKGLMKQGLAGGTRRRKRKRRSFRKSFLTNKR